MTRSRIQPKTIVMLTWRSLVHVTMVLTPKPCIILALLSAVYVSRLQAQSTKAELFGVIHDAGMLPVYEAMVNLTNIGTDLKLSVSSDREGAYHFFALPPGTYRIEVSKVGFAGLRREGVVLR